MSAPLDRFAQDGGGSGRAASGWMLEPVTPPSRLYGANGSIIGPDGRLYVTQGFGGRVSALDLDDGTIETIVPIGVMTAPDDVAFDSGGTMYMTDTMPGRVWARSPAGEMRVIAEGRGTNGITCYRDRVFADESVPGGRVLEVFGDGREPRVLAAGVTTPNALAVGPDEMLYFPQVHTGDVMRLPLSGGEPELVGSGFAVPNAVKFDPAGVLTVAAGASGEVIKVDVASGERRTIAKIRQGIDNIVFVGDRTLLTSFFNGSITEIAADGGIRDLIPPGLVWPLGIAFVDGEVLVADGFALKAARGEEPETVASWLDEDFDGAVLAVGAAPGSGPCLTTSSGEVRRRADGEWKLLASGLDEPIGVLGLGDGAIAVAETGAGRVLRLEADGSTTELAAGCGRPTGLALGADGSLVASDAAGGRLLRLREGGAETIATGFGEPHGVAWVGSDLAVLDVGDRSLSILEGGDGERRSVASELPVGPPPGTSFVPQGGIPGMFPGPIPRFAGLASAPDGTIYVAADGAGCVLALRRAG